MKCTDATSSHGSNTGEGPAPCAICLGAMEPSAPVADLFHETFSSNGRLRAQGDVRAQCIDDIRTGLREFAGSDGLAGENACLAKTICGHTFHASCLAEHVASDRGTVCPLCVSRLAATVPVSKLAIAPSTVETTIPVTSAPDFRIVQVRPGGGGREVSNDEMFRCAARSLTVVGAVACGIACLVMNR